MFTLNLKQVEGVVEQLVPVLPLFISDLDYFFEFESFCAYSLAHYNFNLNCNFAVTIHII